jgi:hypothetical protein
MANYYDSLGNVYHRLPKAPPVHKAKPTTETSKRRSSKHRQNGVTRNTSKYARYRAMRGRPLGPGVPGNKAGKNKVRQKVSA